MKVKVNSITLFYIFYWGILNFCIKIRAYIPIRTIQVYKSSQVWSWENYGHFIISSGSHFHIQEKEWSRIKWFVIWVPFLQKFPDNSNSHPLLCARVTGWLSYSHYISTHKKKICACKQDWITATHLFFLWNETGWQPYH